MGIPCIARQILNHWIIREAPTPFLFPVLDDERASLVGERGI